MSNKSPPKWLAWLPVISAAAIVAGVLFTTGSKVSVIDDTARRVGLLETKSDARDEKLDRINERTARIEAKLEVLVSSGAQERPK